MNKTIGYVVIAVALAGVYFLYQRMNKRTSTTIAGAANYPTNTAAGQLNLISPRSEEGKALIQGKIQEIIRNQKWMRDVLEKAARNGITFEEQAYQDAVWVLKQEGYTFTA